MPWSTTEVSHYEQSKIGPVACYVHQWYIILLVDCRLPQCWLTHIRLDAALYFCYFQFSRQFWNVCLWLYVQWLHRQRCGVFSVVCVAAASQLGEDWMKYRLFDCIWIHSQLSEVNVEPRLGIVEMVRTIVKQRSGKSWGIYSQLHVKIEWVTAKMHILLKKNPAVYSSRLQGFQLVLGFAVSRSNVVCVFSQIHCSEPQLKSHVP